VNYVDPSGHNMKSYVRCWLECVIGIDFWSLGPALPGDDIIGAIGRLLRSIVKALDIIVDKLRHHAFQHFFLRLEMQTPFWKELLQLVKANWLKFVKIGKILGKGFLILQIALIIWCTGRCYFDVLC